ncbi:MAG: chalcone isomerase family protein, partial [Aeromonas allosaccharophila]
MNWKTPTTGIWGGINPRLLAFALLAATAVQASAAPWQQLRPVGQGEMNWLWFKLYDATLYSASGRYQPGHYPQALTLTYARSIEREDLLSATAAEW